MLMQTMSFEEWITIVEREVASDIEPSAYYPYYVQGLDPHEAIELDREDAM